MRFLDTLVLSLAMLVLVGCGNSARELQPAPGASPASGSHSSTDKDPQGDPSDAEATDVEPTGPKNYTGHGISFDYPREFTKLSENLVANTLYLEVRLEDPARGVPQALAFLELYSSKRKSAAGLLSGVKAEAKQPTVTIEEFTRQLAGQEALGVKAFQEVGETTLIREIYAVKLPNDKVLKLVCTYQSTGDEKKQEDFAMIVDSLKFVPSEPEPPEDDSQEILCR